MSNAEGIDIVIPWVDPTDPIWREEHRRVAAMEGVELADDSEARYRDWETLKYFFRSVDKFLPWVRTVHFVTYGHLPDWMDPGAPRLHIVNHRDYISPEYLPTYSSHTIELNMHRIPGLSERFIYFNDDIVLLQSMQETDFFRDGLPCDYAVLYPMISDHRYSVMDVALTDIEVINDHFSARQVVRKNIFKWLNPKYGKYNLITLSMLPWPRFSHLYGKHLCNSFLKSTFAEVWSEEGALLDSTCRHKFRTRRDVNQWVMREWQLASGRFAPVSPDRGQYYGIGNDNSALLSDIRHRRYKIICLNDNNKEEIRDFAAVRDELVAALEEVLPEKSSFEKQ